MGVIPCMEETKGCRACGEEKPVSEFYPKSSAKDGLQTYCRECSKAKAATGYGKDRSGRIRQVDEWRVRNPGKVALYEKTRASRRKSPMAGEGTGAS